MYIVNSSPTLTNCTFVGNNSSGVAGGSGKGAGIYNSSSSPLLTNCIFENNSAVEMRAVAEGCTTIQILRRR